MLIVSYAERLTDAKSAWMKTEAINYPGVKLQFSDSYELNSGLAKVSFNLKRKLIILCVLVWTWPLFLICHFCGHLHIPLAECDVILVHWTREGGLNVGVFMVLECHWHWIKDDVPASSAASWRCCLNHLGDVQAVGRF